MSRRPLQHPVGRLVKAQSRMAPGGLVWSEAPVPRQASPQVRSLGVPSVCVDYPPPYPPSAPGNYCPVMVPGPCTVHITIADETVLRAPSVVVIQLYAQDSHDEAVDAVGDFVHWSADFPAWPSQMLANVVAFQDVLYGYQLTLVAVQVCPLGVLR